MVKDMWQREYIEKNNTQSSDSQEWGVDLPDTGLISAVDIQMRATNGTTSNKDNPLDYILKKVEVLGDGSTVIASLEGRDLRKLNMFDARGQDGMVYDENASAYQYCTLRLPFSRVLYDPHEGLNANDWTSLKLNLEYDMARTRAVSATTAYATGTARFNVIAHRKTGTPSGVRGFLKTREVDDYTSVGGSVEHSVELPRQNQYVRAMVHAYEAAVADGTDITYLELDLEEGGKIPFKANWEDLQFTNEIDYGLNNLFHGLLFKSDTDTIATLLGVIDFATCHSMQTQDITADSNVQTYIASIAGDTVTLDCATIDVTSGGEDLTANTTDHTIYVQAHGRGVGNCVMVPLGQLGDGSTFDSNSVSKTEINLTDSAAGATVRTVLQELVTKQGG